MGFVYKLIPEISSFIIEQKQNDPRMSCQNLAGMVFTKFGQHVSKSSVHELLKQAHVIVPRPHKIKEKFQIPLERKVQIFKALEPFASKPVMQEDPPEISPGMGEIFLKCALWDLSRKPILGINEFSDINSLKNSHLKMEWEYLTQVVLGIELELQDNNKFFIDSRFHGLYADSVNQASLAATIERVACEVPDCVLNNIKPLIISEYNPTDLDTTGMNFISVFENLPGKAIKKVSLIGAKNQVLAEFNLPLAYKRQFILGIPYDCKEFQWAKESSEIELGWETSLKDSFNNTVMLRVLKKENRMIVTNSNDMSYNDLMKLYLDQFPFQKTQLTAVHYHLEDSFADQPQWFKNRLKERALMFFPSEFPMSALEEVLNLEGSEAYHETWMQVRLKVPDDFLQREKLIKAVENLNNIDIRDYKSRKICVDTEFYRR